MSAVYRNKPKRELTRCGRCGCKRTWQHRSYDIKHRRPGSPKPKRCPPRSGWRAHCPGCEILAAVRMSKRFIAEDMQRFRKLRAPK